MNYFQKVLGAARLEIKEIIESWYMLSFLSWIPLVGFGLIVAIFISGWRRPIQE